MSTGSSILSIFGMLIILALIVAGIVWLVSSRRSGPRVSDASASEILDRRLANGEITSEQYDELRERLGAARRDQGPSRPVGTPG